MVLKYHQICLLPNRYIRYKWLCMHRSAFIDTENTSIASAVLHICDDFFVPVYFRLLTLWKLMLIKFWYVTKTFLNWATGQRPFMTALVSSRAMPPGWSASTGGKTVRCGWFWLLFSLSSLLSSLWRLWHLCPRAVAPLELKPPRNHVSTVAPPGSLLEDRKKQRMSSASNWQLEADLFVTPCTEIALYASLVNHAHVTVCVVVVVWAKILTLTLIWPLKNDD